MSSAAKRGGFSDVTREVVDAFLFRELASALGTTELASIDRVIRALVGNPDNVTLDGLDRLAARVGIDSAEQILDPGVYAALEAELETGDYTAQGINSQILMSDPLHPGGVELPYSFLLLGQRFVVDSYVFENVVYDAIEFEGHRPFRGLPDPLDVLFALGNDDVLPLLRDELQTHHYAANLSALRRLIDGYEPEMWSQSLYTAWLQAIRTLSATGSIPGVPDFMTTGAWQQEKMNTQLASWTELRHDNLLYAKQSYTDGGTCSYPRTYIEPVPAFYRALGDFAARAADAFSSIPPGLTFAGQIEPFFANMRATMDRLATISEKELAGASFAPEEIEFLADVLVIEDGCAENHEWGWYRDLYFSSSTGPASEEDLLVADVHTQPTDAGGEMIGHVLHVATGYPELGVFIATPPGQPSTAFVGPVATYHEYVTANFDRLTDEEWAALYRDGPPTRPDWTFVYLADENGDVRDGPRLVDGFTPTLPPGSPPSQAAPAVPTLVLAQNQPNPFNPSTVIGFRLDVAGRADVTLTVFDVHGRRVSVLLEDRLASGAYFTRWDGTDADGDPCASGTYLARLRVGQMSETRLMTLVR